MTTMDDSLLRDCLYKASLGRKMRILVAGSPPGTFHQVSRDARLLLMPSSEPGRLDSQRVVSQDIGAIVYTKMLSHALSRNLHRQAKERDLFICGPFSDGSVLRLLHSVLDIQESPMPRKPAAPLTAPMPQISAAVPAAAAPEQQVTSATLEMLDNAIAELQLVRESVASMLKDAQARSEALQKFEQLKALLK